jgi:hypothetical protein
MATGTVIVILRKNEYGIQKASATKKALFADSILAAAKTMAASNSITGIIDENFAIHNTPAPSLKGMRVY